MRALAIATIILASACAGPGQFQRTTRRDYPPAVRTARQVFADDMAAMQAAGATRIGRMPRWSHFSQRIAAENGGTHIFATGQVIEVYRVEPALTCKLPPELRPREPLRPHRCE